MRWQMQNIGYHYSYLEVDLGVIRQNYLNLQKACRQKIIPVAKGNAWGQGTVPVVGMLFDKLGLDTVALAHVSEAVKVREAGYTTQTIMVLSGVPLHAIPYIVKYKLLMMVYNRETVNALSKAVRNAGLTSFPVQIKVDTGFHRIGVPMEGLSDLVDAVLEAGNLEIAGFCSHYADAYNIGSEKTLEQYELYKQALALVRSKGVEPKYISIGCSPNIDWPEDDISTHIRVGWGYIAYTPARGFEDYHGNHTSMSLRSFITDIHKLNAGDTLGYSGIVLDKPATTATISIGYCDGLYRQLTMHGAPLLIRGQYAHYLDESMDQTIIDVTGLDVHNGDEVTIFGKDKYSDSVLTPTELAKYADGSSSILHLYLSDRVARIYKN